MNQFLTEDDVKFETARSGGPGGQHADRRETAVRLRVAVDDLPVSEEKQKFVREQMPPRHLTDDDEIIVSHGGSRSQARNRKEALKIANRELQEAIEAGKREKNRDRPSSRTRPGGGGGGSGRKDIEKRRRQRRSESTRDLLEEAFEEEPEGDEEEEE